MFLGQTAYFFCQGDDGGWFLEVSQEGEGVVPKSGQQVILVCDLLQQTSQFTDNRVSRQHAARVTDFLEVIQGDVKQHQVVIFRFDLLADILRGADEVLSIVKPGVSVTGAEEVEFLLDFPVGGMVTDDYLGTGFSFHNGRQKTQLCAEFHAIRA